MVNSNLYNLNILFMAAAAFAEGIAYLFFRKYQLKVRGLWGTGRVNDIDTARNWQFFFAFVLVVIPIVIVCFRFY